MTPHLRATRAASRLLSTLALCAMTVAAARADEPFLHPPINYHKAPDNNAVSRLQKRIDAGDVTLKYDDTRSYLGAVLDALNVPRSSQMLVFSKTSLQRTKITPRTPRALYFNDDTYVGWCLDGDVIEISTIDPVLGSVFYTMDTRRVDDGKQPRFVRDKGQCLSCHASSRTEFVPGLMVRSVFVDRQGLPVPGSSTYTNDQNSPFEERWGGWYVTGTHGKMRHLGNAIVTNETDPEKIDVEAGANCKDLSKFVDTSPYLTSHSDLVALLVLEHQAQMHNLITHAGFETRIALYQQDEMNRALGEPADHMRESTIRRMESVAEPLLKYMLFVNEAPLTDPVEGTTTFARDFTARGPRDSKGRSLRDLDLHRWTFQYPLSFLIYSDAWDHLPKPMLDLLYHRLWDILHGKDTTGNYDMMSTADREAIIEILRETKAGLPEYWLK